LFSAAISALRPALVRTGRFRDFLCPLDCADARVRRCAGAGGSDSAVIPVARTHDVAGGWSLAVGAERRLPRRAVHAPVPRADLDVRVADRVSVHDRAGALAMALRLKPDGRRDRWVPLGVARHRGTVAAAPG